MRKYLIISKEDKKGGKKKHKAYRTNRKQLARLKIQN